MHKCVFDTTSFLEISFPDISQAYLSVWSAGAPRLAPQHCGYLWQTPKSLTWQLPEIVCRLRTALHQGFLEIIQRRHHHSVSGQGYSVVGRACHNGGAVPSRWCVWLCRYRHYHVPKWAPMSVSLFPDESRTLISHRLSREKDRMIAWNWNKIVNIRLVLQSITIVLLQKLLSRLRVMENVCAGCWTACYLKKNRISTFP